MNIVSVRSNFDQLAQVHVGSVFRDARRLLHVVRDDDDRESFLSSAISSSMRAVEIGSSAEVGSSNSSTSGLTAMQRAMQSRCCWPPEKTGAALAQLVLHLFPQRAFAQRPLDALVHCAAASLSCIETPNAMLS